MAENRIKITLVRSPIACKPEHRRTVEALGLRRLGASVEKAGSPAVLGMVRSISYLLDVEEIRS
jgi:large subunit ribosomal protein L30